MIKMQQTDRRFKSTGGFLSLCLAVFVVMFCSSHVLAQNLRPKKIISFDLCVDQLLLGIVPKEKIAAVTFLTSDENYSTMSWEYKGLPITGGSVEDVFKYKADLVLVGEFEPAAKVRLMKNLGFNVHVIPLALSVSNLRQTILKIGQLTGHEENATKLIRHFNKELQDLGGEANPEGKGRKSRAIFLAARRHTQGKNSVVNTLFDISGYQNIALETGHEEGGFVGLEQLIDAAPDLIMIGKAKTDAPSLATGVLSHPALRDLARNRQQVDMEQKYLLCLTPGILEAARQLKQKKGTR